MKNNSVVFTASLFVDLPSKVLKLVFDYHRCEISPKKPGGHLPFKISDKIFGWVRTSVLHRVVSSENDNAKEG